MEQEQFNIDWEKLENILEKPEQERVSLIEQLSPDERKALEQWQQLRADTLLTGALQLDTQLAWKKTLGAIGETPMKPVRGMQWKRWVAAACIILLGGVAWLVLRQKTGDAIQEQSVQQGMAGHIPDSKVQLITAGGQTIEVDSMKKFSEADGTTINLQEGTMTYQSAKIAQATPDNNTGKTLMNTLIVPRGYLQSMVLSDGTKVWLNADSRIYFPVRFGKQERRVAVQGEVYFEVSQHAQWPFIVSVHRPDNEIRNKPDAEVQVLGTSFNVKAYSNTIYTTLATGSVLFRPSTGNSLQLSPNQQVTFKTQTGSSTIQKVSSEDYTSWRDDELVMNKMSLAELAALLERRYDVQIVFSNEALKNIEYSVALHLTPQVADMLENLEQTGLVRFAVKDKKITVIPNEK
jgi:transmembrane sensor